MKSKILLAILILLILVGCSKTNDGKKELNEFNEYLEIEDIVRYDLRTYGSCENGHIKGFICIRGLTIYNKYRTLEESVDVIKRNKKSKTIILIDEDGADALYVYNELKKSGYKNVVYFSSGYESYKEQMGSSFIPEIGCEASC